MRQGGRKPALQQAARHAADGAAGSGNEGPALDGRAHRFAYFAIALSVTAWVQASVPGSFLITGSLPPASSTFTVR